ncbi:hypothetical protein GALMADRAFT_1364505 [Galerina marginata CBS 339.88]|uniref:Uncharacterized protein n=1 Tax=Galerina marginata (strain CBS 339.88) TaxID=685588 RepID=A0A067S4A1_GALM3|nr:hypothetical protein GALMADRAFT_1364505 [Galerina marginata CBS 339.88]
MMSAWTDCDQMEENLFRNPVLVMVHFIRLLFVLHDFGLGLEAHFYVSKLLIEKRTLPDENEKFTSQDEQNDICYARFHSIYMPNGGISNIEDWRIEDKLFKREQFYALIMALFNDVDDGEFDWVKDTIEWWDACRRQVFGSEPKSIDESDNELGPSTLAIIEKQRGQCREREAQNTKAETDVAAAADHATAARDPAPPPSTNLPPRSSGLQQSPHCSSHPLGDVENLDAKSHYDSQLSKMVQSQDTQTRNRVGKTDDLPANAANDQPHDLLFCLTVTVANHPSLTIGTSPAVLVLPGVKHCRNRRVALNVV